MIKMLASASVLSLALVATPTLAQDTPTTFDGLYVSGAVGLDAVDTGRPGLEFDTNRDGTFGDVVRTTTGANAFSPGFCVGAANGNAPGAGCDNDSDDLGYAVRVGFDKRFGMFVGGVLVEGAKSDAVESQTSFSTTPASYTYTRGVDYSVAARARLGISPGDGRGLLYATGGVAYADIDRTFTTTNGANSFTPDGNDDMQFGYQVGGGGEILLGNSFTIGLEYLYSNYKDEDAFVAVGPGTAPATNPFLLNGGGTNLRPADTKLDSHSFRVTAGFRF
ncbi:outer membrane protein [Tsuneonella amylolytica]|uniref:outer membrane protein n=1 Tax=Tsuneonella amylolytica TaxID=2338327 RepID=UPI000EA87357|nr:outer membrane beta-barrel protein [Tsuneonella amylolytica]